MAINGLLERSLWLQTVLYLGCSNGYMDLHMTQLHRTENTQRHTH